MKREERHKLQHNELADWLAKAIERLKPYQNVIMGAVVVVLVVALGMAWFSHSSQATTARAWDQVVDGLDKGNATTLAQVADEYPSTTVGDVAAVVSADFRLADGCDRLFHDKAIAEQRLTQAIEAYGKELEQGADPSLQQRATFGLARAWEAKGDLDLATKRYQEVVAKWPDGAFAAAARERLDDLKRPAVKQLYDDLRKFTPKTVAPRESERPGETPGFAPEGLLDNPPAGGPDLNFEDLGKGKGKPKGKEAEKPKEKGGAKGSEKPKK